MTPNNIPPVTDISLDDLRSATADASDRRVLARAITLIESTRPDHREAARKLINAILPETGNSVRLGITGIPGVGKSTFIETFGLYLIGLGHKVAVLTVDPSSQRSGGSIQGDKTRMEDLSRAPQAFIRPSPAGGMLGGVARHTREAVLLCEAAGFDIIIVETVGVGQSEIAVADMTDMFLLLLAPGGGDELQGIKKGIVERADLLIVNKADGDLKQAANRAAADYSHALGLLAPALPDWRPPVLQCSALERQGIEPIWHAIQSFRDMARVSGYGDKRRQGQIRSWFRAELSEGLAAHFHRDEGIAHRLPDIEAQVLAGKISAVAAAEGLLKAFFKGRTE